MSDKDLVTLPEGGAVVVQDDEVFKEATQSGDYLPRLQLMTSNSKICKDGQFTINHFAIVRDQNHQDVGESVDILVIAWRAKAIEIGGQTGPKIKEALYKIDNLPGVTGPTTFDEWGEVRKPYNIYIVRNGRFEIFAENVM